MKSKYKVQEFKKSCVICHHLFIKIEYDEYPEYYCTHGCDKRPSCCSVAMGEPTDWDDDTEPHPYDIWEDWCEPREVVLNGVCDDYKEIMK